MRSILLATFACTLACRSSDIKIDSTDDIQDEQNSEEQSETEEEKPDDWKGDEDDWKDEEEKPDDWNGEDKPDDWEDEDWDGGDKPDDWEDDEEEEWEDWLEEDSDVLLGDYTANFELYSGNFNLLCNTTFDVSIEDNPYPDTDIFASEGDCTTNNNINLSFNIEGELNYYNAEKAQVAGAAIMTPPNGTPVFSEISGTCYEFGSIGFTVEWVIDTMTPNGQRTFYAFLSL